MNALPISILVLLSFGICSTAQHLSVNSPSCLSQGAVSTIQNDLSSVVLNPAGTAGLKASSIQINYDLRYTTKELGQQNLAFIQPTNLGVVSAFVARFGYSVYNETRVGFNFAKFITPQFKASLQFNIQSNYVAESGRGNQIYSGVGFQFLPVANVILGFYCSNPEKSAVYILEEASLIPSIYALGVRWYANELFSLSTEFEKEVDFKYVLKFGLNYAITDRLNVRGGLFGAPMNYTLGMGFRFSDFRFDVAVAQHQNLGLSSSAGLSYQFKHKP